MPTYRIPPNVQASMLFGRHTLSTPQGGRVAVDASLLSLWQNADGRTLEEISSSFGAEGATGDLVRAGLACLAESGLLLREGERATIPIPAHTTGALVSVVIVSYKSRDWLKDCLPSLFSQSYSPLEIIVVDNASADGSVEWLRVAFPSVRLVELNQTLPLAAAINRGAETASGAYVLLLNPDVRLAADAVAEMVRSAETDPACAAIAAKLKFSWAPSFLNGLGNRVGAFSWGTDNALGFLDLGQFESWDQVPSACFAAALIPRSAWEVVGPVDEGFPLYYEDSEWCYRARLLGRTVRAAPRAEVYHAFGGRVPSGQEENLSPRKLRNVAYGRLRFALKIVGSPYVRRFLRNYLLEDCANFSHAVVGLNWRAARAYLEAWLGFLRDLPRLLKDRRALQARRARSDDELFGLQKQLAAPLVWHGLPELTWDIVRTQYAPCILAGRTRPMPEFSDQKRRPHLLIVSHDVVDKKMAGPGMRYLEMARAISPSLDVTLAVPSESTLEQPGVNLVRYWEERPGSLQVLVENSDVALISGYMVQKFPFLQDTRTRLVADLYDPLALENLHYYVKEPLSAQQELNRQAVDIMNRMARLGDYFICASERQRDYWMGVLTANGRVNPQTFAQDSSLRSLIDVVGIGLPDREPRPRPALRGIHPAFPAESRIVLWGGGVWDWLDPLTLVEAWPKVLQRHPEARLVFLGTRHPNPAVPRHKMAERTEALAAQLGEKDGTIFFIEWLPYDDREGLLCEADIGVTLHPVHVETRYSMRTRVLDYFWARLPVVITCGDVTSEWIERFGVGRVVPPLDGNAVANALCEVLDQPKAAWAPAFEAVAEEFRWSRMVEPLVRYCEKGAYSADRPVRPISKAESLPQGSLRERVAHARYLWRTEGFRVMLHRVWRYIQWRLASM